MDRVNVDEIIAGLLPQVLADRELGNGRSFTECHLGVFAYPPKKVH